MALKVTERKLRKELKEAEQRLERNRGRYGEVSWLELVPVARCLHWLGDPTSRECFREAAGLVRLTGEPEPLLMFGNYLRLAGDHEEARPHLERAYAEYKERYDLGQLLSTHFGYMLDCALLVGEDEDLEEIARGRGHDYLATRLARARRTEDARLAAQVVEEYAEDLRETRIKVGASASATSPWDFYEIALRTRAALEEKAPDPDARPLDLALWASENPPPDPPPEKERLTRDQAWDAIVEGLGRNEQAELSNTDLSGLDLSGADLDGAALAGAVLRGANLSGSSLIEANLDAADLREADLGGAALQQVVLSNANLSGVDFSKAKDGTLAYADLGGADASGANLSSLDMRYSTLTEADLSGANLSGADLSGADLRGANLNGANLEGATMEDVVKRNP
jgi:uncharacterized protein YjbI with pentapeptide repeats